MRRSGPGSELRWLGPNDADAVPLIAALHAKGTRGDLYALAMTLVGRPAVSEAARYAAGAILRRTASFDLLGLDAQMRSRAADDAPMRNPWSSVGSDQVDRVAHGVERLAVLGLLSMHPVGYVRERAVVVLASAGPEAFPWLLVRTVDWVAPIRRRATEAMLASLRDENADAVRRVLPLARRLRDFTRANARTLVDRIEAFVVSQPIAVLERGLASADRGERRLVLQLLDQHGRIAMRHLERALDDSDLAIRTMAARILAERPTLAPAGKLASLTKDRSARIRAIALEAAIATTAASTMRTMLIDALEDTDRFTRATARHHLGRLDPHVEVRARHRVSVASATPTVGAIRALAETGTPDDWERLVPSIELRSSIAREAIVAMARLDRAASREMRLMLVDDPRPGVSRTATATTVGALWETEVGIVRSYLASPHLHVRENALRLVARLPGWQPALRYLEIDDVRLVGLAERELARWIVRVWRRAAPPTPAMTETIRAALARSPLGARPIGARLRAVLDIVAK